uniref:Serine peptidase inhibitor Kazal type 13 n=1 Tax=Sus scrofa TaxID=9823 RepID=A0A5G2RAQ3_PIG
MLFLCGAEATGREWRGRSARRYSCGLLWCLQPPCEMYYPWGPRRDSICPDVTAHVCATNGETYKNECFFCLDHWEFGPYVQFYKYGKCK